MANRTDDLIEANKRGLLSGKVKSSFDEAVNRGLITLPDQQGVQNVNVPDSGLGLPSDNITSQQPSQQGVEQEKGFLAGVGEFFSGSERETRATRELPEIGQGGLLFGESDAKIGAITPALLTTTNPQEMAQILQSNFENIGIKSDEKGNLIAANNKTGAKVVLNKPDDSHIKKMKG